LPEASLLSVQNLEVVYSDVILVLRGVSLTVPERSIVALLGANGAGKTTLLRAVTGLLPIHRGRITKGQVRVGGEEVNRLEAPEILRSGGFTCPSRAELTRRIEKVYQLFPKLAERRNQTAGYLSGGEQQMLAVGRALMSNPRLLILDEPSLGLAPKIVEQIAELIVSINRDGTAVLLVEQNATMALRLASYGYILENGKIVKDGTPAALEQDQDVREFYLGLSDTGRRSFREIKTYRRKKRWSA
jgi:branched-chain amino acid transport system ATP-binding protein